LQLDPAVATAAVQGPLRDHDLPKAITALAALLPHQQEGEEFPDIIEEFD
jgi:ferric-dicitrate binding protein FerR (iron transport regulator)